MAVDTIHRAHHAGGVTFTASKGLGATDGVNTPALQGLSSIAGVITSLVRAGCGTTADTVLLAPHDSVGGWLGLDGGLVEQGRLRRKVGRGVRGVRLRDLGWVRLGVWGSGRVQVRPRCRHRSCGRGRLGAGARRWDWCQDQVLPLGVWVFGALTIGEVRKEKGRIGPPAFAPRPSSP